MQDLYRLVYFSRNQLAGNAEEKAERLQSLLDFARRNNAALDVTGALIFNQGWFAQVLEGARAAVMHTFERIQQDDRHDDVTLLCFDQVERRAFGTWSLAYAGDATLDGGMAGETEFDPSCMTAKDLFETIEELVHEEEPAHA